MHPVTDGNRRVKIDGRIDGEKDARMSKRITEAVRELREQDDICELHCSLNAGWKATTGNLISSYTGEHSEFYQEHLKWSHARNALGYNDDFAAGQQAKTKLLIRHVIQHIERRGIYTPPQRQIIEKLPDWQTISAIVSVMALLFVAGYQTGAVYTKLDLTKEQIKSEAQLDSFKRAAKSLPALVDSSNNKAKQKTTNQGDKRPKQDSTHKKD